MRNMLIGVVVLASLFALWRFAPATIKNSAPVRAVTDTVSPATGTTTKAATSEGMTTQQLLELSKTDPKAFNAYVQAHINDAPPPASGPADAKTAKKRISLEEFANAGKTDTQAVAAFLESNVEDETENTPLEKFFNLLSHGKYE